MTLRLSSLTEVADRYGAIVLDQWGVLHDGTRPYPGAVAALEQLRAGGTRLAVLSNSGKRAAPNRDRIAAMGFAPGLFDCIMTSGEALWQDIATGRATPQALLPMQRNAGDAQGWANGLPLRLVDDLDHADGVLAMGLPDAPDLGATRAILAEAMLRDLPLYCTNPDRASPRAGGQLVTSPGSLAHEYADAGGAVRFYGKPHLPVFRAVEAALHLPTNRLLMVGDSLEHDIAGAQAAGWASAFVEGGLHAATLRGGTSLHALAQAGGIKPPDFTLATLG